MRAEVNSGVPDDERYSIAGQARREVLDRIAGNPEAASKLFGPGDQPLWRVWVASLPAKTAALAALVLIALLSWAGSRTKEPRTRPSARP